MKLTEMSAEELAAFKAEVQKEYDDFKAQGLSLNMARGKPSAEQLDLTEGLLTAVKSSEDCFAEDGTDCRNYGGLDGLPEAKALFAPMLGVTPDELIICGNSSLNIMYDTIAKFMLFGTGDGEKPWKDTKVKWLCPVPGRTIWVSRTWRRSSTIRREVICFTKHRSITGSAGSVGMGYPWTARDSMYISGIMKRRITIPSPVSR